ncbi:MAG: hypothetical protein Kow0092_11070 [Deferrisomatales bacterium]
MSGAWGCPHEARGRCGKRGGAPCEPGAKGCVLEGRFAAGAAGPERTPHHPRGGGRGPGGGGRGRQLTVDRREAGLRLDRFLTGAVPGLSRKQAKRLVDGRKVWVDGRIEPMASRVLRGGERVRVDLEAPAPERPPPTLTVLYEDEGCLAVDKPAGLPSGPTRDPSRAHAEALAEARAGAPLTLLHRLDKDTTGVLLLAKTRPFAEALTRAFRERRVEKVYLALVRGTPPPAFDAVSHLREGEGGRMHAVRSGGARAETRFATLAARGGWALVEARPRTGRTHQIRVQLARAGYPIVGDALYGGAGAVEGRAVPRQMLHALRLGFVHPGSGRAVTVEAPVPEDFLEAARAAFGGRLPRPLLSPKAPGGRRRSGR